MNNILTVSTLWYKRILLSLAILCGLYLLVASNSVFWGLFLFPVIYGVGLCLILPHKIQLAPGFMMLNVVFFIRYILFPVYFVLDNYETRASIKYYYLNESFLLMYIELIVILMTMWFFLRSRKRLSLIPISNKVNSILPFLSLGIILIVLIFYPEIYGNKHFILSPMSMLNERIEFNSSVLIKIVEWGQVFVIVYFALLFRRKGHFFLVFITVLIPCLFFSGSSRLSLLRPAIMSMFFLERLYPYYRRRIYIFFGTFSLIAMFSLSVVKFYKTTSLTEVGAVETASLLNSYFAGLPNISIGVASYHDESNNINLETVVTDGLQNMLYFSKYFDSQNNSTQIFNNHFYGSNIGYADQIPPTLIQGLYYFGPLFFYLLSVFMLSIVFYGDKRFITSSDPLSVWLYGYMALSIAWALPGSFQHLYMQLHYTFIPLYILIRINDKFTLKKDSRI